MTEQELNKKLAEWAGFTEIELVDYSFLPKNRVPSFYAGFCPDGYKVAPINFTQSLDACFKWLVPKTIKYLADTDLSTEKEAYYKLVGLWLAELNPPYALALCLAVEKLIDSEVK